jgi:hypothetical protein
MLGIIYFFICIFLVGFIYPIISIFNLNNYTKKDIIFNANNLLKKWIGYNIYIISKNKLITKKDIIYLSNHVSFGDFFIDSIITNNSSKFVSRYNIVILFPLYYLISLITNSAIFFKRSNITNMMTFFKWINSIRKSDIYNNILVYPEGLRRPYSIYPIGLKKGFIYYSFDYNLPIQIIHTCNKETIINESLLSIGFKNSIFVYYGEEINPVDYKKKNYSREQYYNYIQKSWNKIWFKVKKNSNIKKYLTNKNKYSNLIKNYPLLENQILNNHNTLPFWFLFIRLFFYIGILYYIIF